MNVDDYIGREFHSLEDLEGLPPCILEDFEGDRWVLLGEHAPSDSDRLTVEIVAQQRPFRVAYLLDLHEVPAPKADAPELTLAAASKLTFQVRTTFDDRPSFLNISSPFGTWWYAWVQSTEHSSMQLLVGDDEPWSYRHTGTQFATAEEALAAAWATPEIKGLA